MTKIDEVLSLLGEKYEAGSLNLDNEMAGAISEAIRESGRSVHHIAADMTILTGREIRGKMLYDWSAPSRDVRVPRCTLIPALCVATRSFKPLKVLLNRFKLEMVGPNTIKLLQILENRKDIELAETEESRLWESVVNDFQKIKNKMGETKEVKQ